MSKNMVDVSSELTSTSQILNGVFDRLQKKQATLSRRFNDLDNRLNSLYDQLKRTTGSTYEIDQDIKNVKSQLDQVDHDLRIVEKEYEELCEARQRYNPIYFDLLNLNYIPQADLFRDLIRKSRIGAFVIHGDYEHGQEWLCSRLVKKIEFHSHVIKKRVYFNRNSVACSSDTLPRDLEWPGIFSLQQLAEKIYEEWDKHSIIILFKNFDKAGEKFRAEFIKEFWKKLVKKVTSTASTSENTWILLFFAEENESGDFISEWPVTTVEQIDPGWEPSMFIKSPKLIPFGRNELVNFIEKTRHKLPPERSIEHILQSDQVSTPEGVFMEICDCFNLDYRFFRF